MKTLICLLVAGMCCMQVQAQRIHDKQMMVENGLIDLQFGLAIPVMDFADKNFKPASGYATLGYAVKLGIRYDIAPFCGIALHYQYFQNGFDDTKYISDVRDANTNLTIHSYTTDPWNLQGMLIGLYFPYKSARTSLDAGFGGGVLSGVYPENTLNFSRNINPGVVYNIKQYETSAANFAFQVGVKMRYQLYQNIMVSASADFTYTEIPYKDIRAEETTTQTPIPLDTYTQYYHIVQLAAGIGIQVR